jgi:hypothetical protein
MIRDRHQLTPYISVSGQLRTTMRRSGYYLFLITLLAVPVLQPLFSTQLSCGFDTVFHLWRSVQANALLEEGIFLSRWAPQMAHGYGYPLFLFQSPLTAWGTAVFHQIGLSWPVALNMMYGLGIVASGWTMWWLARTFWGDMGGVVAAVAYLYAPFHAYVAFYRASLSETVAWSLPPLILWGLYSWQKDRSGWGLSTAVFSFILLMLTHDVTAYAFMPIFVGWIVLWGVGSRVTDRKQLDTGTDRSWIVAWRGATALLLGLGGSAFFWLPAIVERDAIQFSRANSAWPFLYFNNFLPLNQLLALPRNADPSLLNDWPPRALGGLLLAAALAGGLLAWRRGGFARWLAGFFLLGLAGYLFLTVSLSEPLWTAVSQLAAFQFPWRFLAPASFLAAFLAGGIASQPPGGSALDERHGNKPPGGFYWTTILVVGLLSVGHWGWLFPNFCDVPDDLSVAGMVNWEVATQTLGSTASGELLPRDVEIMPDPINPPAWQARLDVATLPLDTKLLTTSYQPLASTIELETATSASSTLLSSSEQAIPFQATLHIFNFPGWRVTVNGEPVVITSSDPEGWITFPVGNGRSVIKVTFGETPLRLAADGLSLFSLLLLGVIIRKKWLVRNETGDWRLEPGQSLISNPHSPITGYWLLLTLAVLLLGGKLLLVDQQHTSLRQARLQERSLVGVGQPLAVTLGTPDNPAQVQLLGMDEWETAVPADDPLVLTFYWQANQPLDKNYKVGLTLLDENGLRWSEKGLRDYRWLRNPPPTTAWPTDQYALTSFFVDMLPGTPPGSYRLMLSFFEEGTLVPLTFYDAGGLPLGPQIELGKVTLLSPRQPWSPTLPMQHRLAVGNGQATLLGSNVDRTEAAPGDPVLVTLFWQTAQVAEATLRLLDEAGDEVVNWPVTLPYFGDGVWRSQLLLQLPVTLANGRYQWQLSFPNGQAVRWSELAISAPERLLTMPDVQTAVNVTLSEQANLVGFSLDKTAFAAGETLNLQLVWQGVAEMDESYRVFVHLLAADGSIVAQADGLPAGWTRPTTGWLPGEFIRDNHTLTLPPTLPAGQYQLTTGLYLPNASRLQQENGRDNISLTTLTVTNK